MAKKTKIVDPLIMMDDVHPLATVVTNKKSMKKTSKYYKKRKRAFVEVINEYNNFFILPAVRLWFDKDFNGAFDKMFFEISWFNYTLAFKLKS
jgi:hypothetical protein